MSRQRGQLLRLGHHRGHLLQLGHLRQHLRHLGQEGGEGRISGQSVLGREGGARKAINCGLAYSFNMLFYFIFY